MCAPTTTTDTKHVVVVGAGPAGLLAWILLLRRNSPDQVKYRVTLVDPGTDYGTLDADGLNRARSWMIGLSCHGLTAIRQVPDLYEQYIEALGVHIQQAVFGISPKLQFHLDVKDILPEGGDISAFTVDRNYICAALSRYLNDKFPSGKVASNFTSQYHTRALYVDGDNQSIVVRHEKDTTSLDYDILLGCDGIRSVVRNAFLNHHRDFEFDLTGTFGIGKSVHVTLPESVKEGAFMFLNQVMPHVSAFVLPETGGKLNVAMGTASNQSVAPELLSEDPQVVAAYFKENFHAFSLTDYEDVAQQWIGQGWNTISQVHCNFYHSTKLQALLLGDAAHATSPQIGQGMNTALADAAALNQMLDDHKDDWTAVLPQFSKDRVKEGHALTDLSFYTFSLSPQQQLMFMMRQTIRRTLHKWLPALVYPDPMNEVAKGMLLSEAYSQMDQWFGIIPAARKVNDHIMRTHFHKEIGLIADDNKSSFGWTKKAVLWGALPVAAACFLAGRK